MSIGPFNPDDKDRKNMMEIEPNGIWKYLSKLESFEIKNHTKEKIYFTIEQKKNNKTIIELHSEKK